MSSAIGHNQPDYSLTVNGQNITPKVGPRLINLRLRESRGDEADQLDIELDDADGKLAIPPTGATIELRLGWAGAQLVDKGSYKVDEVEHGGTPDRLSIRARSADMSKGLRQRGSKSWHDSSVGRIVRDMADANNLPARVDGELDSLPVEHIDQTNESVLHFLTRLARQNDAVCTVKKGCLVFLRTGSRTNASGQAFAAVQIVRKSGDQHRYHQAERTAYSGVRARWHSTEGAADGSVLAGTDEDTKDLKETYAREQDAIHGARSEMQRIRRGLSTFTLTLALGRPELMPQSPVSVTGFKPEIDKTSWLVKTVEHSLGEGGFTTRLEMEQQGSGDASAAFEAWDDDGASEAP